MSIHENRGFSLKPQNRMANSVDPDNGSYEPSHQDLQFAQISVLVCMAERLTVSSLDHLCSFPHQSGDFWSAYRCFCYGQP